MRPENRQRSLTLEQAGRVLQRRRRLLVADDDSNREQITAALETEGHDIVAVRDGSELLDQLAAALVDHREAVDLVITDVRMPGWSGLKILEGIRTRDWSLPVIVITGFADLETEEEAARLGATTLLHKPFAIGELRAAVRSALG